MSTLSARIRCPRLVDLALVVPILWSSPALGAHQTTVDDLIRMSQAGVSDATILLFVERNEVCTDLSAADLVRLAESGSSPGLSDGLIEAMAACNTEASLPPRLAVAGVYPGSFYRSSYFAPWARFPSLFFLDHRHSFYALHYGLFASHGDLGLAHRLGHTDFGRPLHGGGFVTAGHRSSHGGVGPREHTGGVQGHGGGFHDWAGTSGHRAFTHGSGARHGTGTHGRGTHRGGGH